MFMAVFNSTPSKGQEPQDLHTNTHIGVGTHFTGNVEASGNIRVDGQVTGDVISKAKIVTGNKSVIQGNVVAENLEVEGEITGKVVVSDTLVLKSTAQIIGDIYTRKLIIEAGAVFTGTCSMGDEKIIKEARSGIVKDAPLLDKAPLPKEQPKVEAK
jgi:cytoskeletal protein CcmA (bactofilin family)